MSKQNCHQRKRICTVAAVAFRRDWQLRVNKVKQIKSGIKAEQKSVALEQKMIEEPNDAALDRGS